MDSLSSKNASQNAKLQELQSEGMMDMYDIPQEAYGNSQKQQTKRKDNESGELIKYMSNLPSYLEKGESLKEKALNFGVLDWTSLEKWQYSHKPLTSQDIRCSPSSSNTSLLFSTDISSNRSSRGKSCSPARQTLQSHLNRFPSEDYSRDDRNIVEHMRKFQDHKAATSNPLKGQPCIFQMYQSFSKNPLESPPKESKRKETSQEFKSHGATILSKGKAKVQDGKCTSEQDGPPDVHYNCHPRSAEPSRRSCSGGSLPKELSNKDDDIKGLETKNQSSMNAKNINFSSKRSPSRCPLRISTSPSRSTNLEENRSKELRRNSAASKSSEVSDLKKGTVEAPKLRNPSPTRRFSIGLSRIGCTSISKEGEEQINAKCGSEKAVDSSCSKHASNERPNSTMRSQSSPLRRLLDPLLKPKASNSHHTHELSEKETTSNGRVESSTVHSVKVRLDLSSCKNVAVETSHQKKHGSTKVEALLQIAVKNGLPLFTFAVDDKSDILAATMRKAIGSRKDESSWIYTFFSVREVKKKNGWMGQGGKGKNHGIVPNVVAKMKVSDSINGSNIREFVMFAVDPRQTDQHLVDHQPNSELAAILLKIPRETLNNSNKDGEQNGDNGSSVHSQDLRDVTVILPGGVHGLPSKGEPSPLIERWKSGGLCDCGGWDLGCRLRVLGTRTKLTRKIASSRPHQVADRFELFTQGEVLEDKPLFSLSLFKDRIFSVEFNSSLSLLQAFSICIAIVNSRKPYELSELSKLFDDRSSEETTFIVNDGIKGPSQVAAEVPASYASYPPLSPVGRV